MVCLLGNKLDMVEQANNDITFRIDRQKFVKDEDIEELLREIPIKYFRSSAKINTNIKEAFNFLAQEIKKQKSVDTSSIKGAGLGGDAKKKDSGSSGTGCC